MPSKEYSYKINNAPATTVQPKSLPPREYGFNFLDGEVIPDPPKPTEKPSQYNYKIYENPPPTTVLPKKIKGTFYLFARCHLRFFFKAPHQTTEYLSLMDRFWSNKKNFGDLID